MSRWCGYAVLAALVGSALLLLYLSIVGYKETATATARDRDDDDFELDGVDLLSYTDDHDDDDDDDDDDDASLIRSIDDGGNEDRDDGNESAPRARVVRVPLSVYGRQRGARCPRRDSNGRGRIYVDLIYNPNYRHELEILRFMLLEILTKNPQIGVAYDYEHAPNSTIVTIGYEHTSVRHRERTVVSVKTKLLKDVLYTENIFLQIYHFLLGYFRYCARDPTRVPEYDRTINFARYRRLFADKLRSVDRANDDHAACRNDELRDDVGVCIDVDRAYVEREAAFEHAETRLYWLELLSRVARVTGTLLERLTGLRDASGDGEDAPCYRVLLRPETDVRKVLLFPHRASKTAPRDELVRWEWASRERIVADVVLFKHRVLHALGLGHRYTLRSVMNSYDNPWQRANLFYLLPTDYESLRRCYAFNEPTSDALRRYVRDDPSLDENQLRRFVERFDDFMAEYAA